MRLKLTPFGEFVMRHSVCTGTLFWRQLAAEVDQMMEEDSDWECMLDERIRGLQEFKKKCQEHGTPEEWPRAEDGP